MTSHRVPVRCPGCSSEAIGLPSAYPPRVQCSACSFSTSGATYHQAYVDWCRRGGKPGHQLVCDGCGHETTDHYDQVGGDCFYCLTGTFQLASTAATNPKEGNRG